MLNIILIFNMHQPYRLRKMSIFDIGSADSLIDYELSKKEIINIAQSSYKPTLKILQKLIKKLDNKIKINISISGVLLEQLSLFYPEIIQLLNNLIETKSVELLVQPYYNSLSFLFDENEFIFEVNKHINLIYALFNVLPSTFKNTELIYNNKIADSIRGFTSIKRIITEPVEKIIGFNSPIYLYKAYGKNTQKILLRNSKLSNDISFNFNNKNYQDYPLTAEKYSKWINDLSYSDKKAKNLYCVLLLNMETFGYHHSENSGIFELLYDFPSLTIKNNKENSKFINCSEIDYDVENNLEVFSTKEYISLAGEDKNLDLISGNDLQKNSQITLYSLIQMAKEQNNENLLEILRKISSVDYFYTFSDKSFKYKFFYDNIIHFPSIESAYQNYLFLLSDIEEKMA